MSNDGVDRNIRSQRFAIQQAGLPPNRWITAQQFALGASLLRLVPSPTEDQLDTLFSPLSVFSQFDDREYLSYLCTLPVLTLHAMCGMELSELGHWKEHYPFWEKARRSVIWNLSTGLSPVAGAKLLANRILDGNFRAPQLIRMASLEIGVNWKTLQGMDEALDRLVSGLLLERNPHDRFAKLADFRVEIEPEIGGEPSGWALVENCLLHQTYSWPAVVLREGTKYQTNVTSPSAFALPIEFHISIGGNGQVNVYPTDRRFAYTDWRSSAERSLFAAKQLWKKDHSSWDAAYHKLVEEAAAVLDLRVAEAIVAPFKEANWITQMNLREGSLEAYLALIALSDFLGDRASMETVCATGVIDSWNSDRIGGDAYMRRPQFVEAKFAWAVSTGIHDTFITVKADPAVTPSLKRIGPFKVCEVGHLQQARDGRRGKALLSDFTAEALTDSQRHRYVRCADIAHAFTNPSKTKALSSISELIRLNKKPVLQLDGSIGARDVARALYLVNAAARHDEDAGTKLGTFTFIRAVENEINERFWRVVWHLLGGTPLGFWNFCFSLDPDLPASLLADELNCFSPSDPSSKRVLRRAPDVLVILGSRHLCRPPSDIPRSPFQRLLLEPIMDRLAARLKPSPVPGITNRIGATRVILIPEDRARRTVSPEQLGGDIREHIQRLAIFRHGFQWQMAQHMLPPDRLAGWDLQELLDELQKRSCEGERLLRFSKRTKEYFMNVSIEPPADRNLLARVHSDAANAIVGLFNRDDEIARFNFREALTPAWLQEAQWHLGRAQGYFPAKSSQLGQAIREHERLSRIGEGFGWTRVRWAATRSKEDDEDVLAVLEEHLSEVRQAESNEAPTVRWVHPEELLWSAKFVSSLADRTRNDKGKQDKFRKYVRYRGELLGWAEAACAGFDTDERGNPSSEGDACRYLVLTARACLNLPEQRDRLDLAKQIFRDAATLAKRNAVSANVFDLQWFEYLGDYERSHLSAIGQYRKGIINDGVHVSIEVTAHSRRPLLYTIIKYIGSCRLADIKPDQRVVLYLARRPPESLQRLQNKRVSTGLFELPQTVARWQRGLGELERIISAESNCVP